jgi:DNA-binding SARP family transcriptional activator
MPNVLETPRPPTRPTVAQHSVELLDRFRVVADGSEPRLPLSAQRLVAHLGLVDRPHRNVVASVLWPNSTERHAHGSLRSTLWRLDQTCRGLVRSAQGALFLPPEVRVDARELTGWARRMLDPADGLDRQRAPDLAFRGELLPGWYDEWVVVERECLHQLRLHALEALAHKLAKEGRFGEALEAAQGVMRCEPLRESAQRLAIRIHLAEGNTAEALRQFDGFSRVLHAELGLRPSQWLTDLIAPYQRVRSTRRVGGAAFAQSADGSAGG